MVRRNKIYILLFFMMLLELKMHGKEYESPIYTQYADEVTNTFLREVYKKYGFECGATGGSMPYDVEKISVSLDANQIATIEQARELEVILTERFVEIINAHEKIRPFLREYPFPASRARIMISFRVPKKEKDSKGNEVELVMHVRDKIYYLAHNYDNPFREKEIKNEPYEEALRIVRNKEKNDSK